MGAVVPEIGRSLAAPRQTTGPITQTRVALEADSGSVAIIRLEALRNAMLAAVHAGLAYIQASLHPGLEYCRSFPDTSAGFPVEATCHHKYVSVLGKVRAKPST